MHHPFQMSNGTRTGEPHRNYEHNSHISNPPAISSINHYSADTGLNLSASPQHIKVEPSGVINYYVNAPSMDQQQYSPHSSRWHQFHHHLQEQHSHPLPTMIQTTDLTLDHLQRLPNTSPPQQQPINNTTTGLYVVCPAVPSTAAAQQQHYPYRPPSHHHHQLPQPVPYIMRTTAGPSAIKSPANGYWSCGIVTPLVDDLNEYPLRLVKNMHEPTSDGHTPHRNSETLAETSAVQYRPASQMEIAPPVLAFNISSSSKPMSLKTRVLARFQPFDQLSIDDPNRRDFFCTNKENNVIVDARVPTPALSSSSAMQNVPSNSYALDGMEDFKKEEEEEKEMFDCNTSDSATQQQEQHPLVDTSFNNWQSTVS